MHPFEIAFFRASFGALLMAPLLLRFGRRSLATTRFPMYLARGAAMVVSTLGWFTAVAHMPIVEVTALTFTSPLFATLGAGLFLREAVGARRWTATLVGFAGAMIVLRPGLVDLSAPAVAAMASAASTAAGLLIVKSLSRTDSPGTIVLYLNLLMVPMSLAPAALVWTPPSLEALVWLAGLGLIANLGHLSFARAMAATEASAIAPVDFCKLFFTAALGYLAFAEVPDALTWVGAAVIFGSSIYAARRESLAGGRGAAPTGAAPSAGPGVST